MNSNILWIYILVLQLFYVTSRPAQDAVNTQTTSQVKVYHDAVDNLPITNDEKVISVRITSSVAVERGNGRSTQKTTNYNKLEVGSYAETTASTDSSEEEENITEQITDLPPNLRGANIEFIKQLNAKKEPKAFGLEHNSHFPSSALSQRYDDKMDTGFSYETKNEQANINEENFPSASKLLLSSDHFNSFRTKSTSVLEDALKLASERSERNETNNDEKFTEINPVTEDAYLTTFDDFEFNDKGKESYTHIEGKEIDDSVAESSIKSLLGIARENREDYENIENVPLARSVHSPSSKNYIQGLKNKPPSERESSTRLTTVSFNIVHDAPKMQSFSDHVKPYTPQSQSFQEQRKFYQHPTIYSQPAQIYSEPAKIYSEPAKIYSEPAKIYSEPAKIYSEPAKIYSEPAKFYSEPASLHLKQSAPMQYLPPAQTPWQQRAPAPPTFTLNTTPAGTSTVPEARQPTRHQTERNYEVNEKVSVLTDGQSHGVQESTTEKCKQDNCKVGYVVKGRQFNKYRVEERTSDGFLVGEYGVVRNEDGALRGVRYTADSEASPRLIYDALMKFLQLK